MCIFCPRMSIYKRDFDKTKCIYFLTIYKSWKQINRKDGFQCITKPAIVIDSVYKKDEILSWNISVFQS